jgi:hypothetical protein
MLGFWGEVLKHKCVEKSMCKKAWAIYICISNSFNMGKRILAPNCSTIHHFALPHQGGDFWFINENILVCQISLDDMDCIAFMGVQKGM